MCRCAVVSLFLLLPAACGGDAPEESAPPPGIELPRIGSVGPPPGDLPAPRVFVTVRSDGTLLLDGRTVAPEGLVEPLAALAGAHRDENDEWKPGLVSVVVVADARAPWSGAEAVLSATMEPGVRIYPVFFAVRPEGDGKAGTLLVSRPVALCACGHVLRHMTMVDPVPVRLRAGAGSGCPPAALVSALRDRPEARWVRLRVDPRLAVGTVLTVLDVLLRSGTRHLDLIARPPGAEAVPGGPAVAAVEIECDGQPLQPSPGMPPPLAPPSTGPGFVGFAQSRTEAVFEEKPTGDK